MKSVCLLGYYGAENFGDEILLGSTIALLDSVESFKINIFTGNEKITAKQYPFYKAIPKFNFLEVITALINSEALILGGGSIFQDVSSLKSVIYYSSVVFLAKMLGKKIIFLSQGIGPLRSYWAKFFTQCSCQMADWITV
ncbi:MAG: polysaccharide pyruvyl transferase family protein, partial [Candidatus Caenarcaniphilales bacterium]|nr:polysaccharide pyruvyl transferase family protein [Candidatus Caenarcaniphilales bacterium]